MRASARAAELVAGPPLAGRLLRARALEDAALQRARRPRRFECVLTVVGIQTVCRLLAIVTSSPLWQVPTSVDLATRKHAS